MKIGMYMLCNLAALL